jgi:hypothetical protein
MWFTFRMAPGYHGGPDLLGPATADRFYTLGEARAALGNSKTAWVVRVDEDGNPTHDVVHRTYPYYRAADLDHDWWGPVRESLRDARLDVSHYTRGRKFTRGARVLATTHGAWGSPEAPAVCADGGVLEREVPFWLPGVEDEA